MCGQKCIVMVYDICMQSIGLGVVIVLVTAFGYASNFLNWRFLNYGVTRFLYYIGALVHETSHAILCVLTGAKIEEFTVFGEQPQVVHRKSKIPLLGELLISAAPIAGGLLFLFLVNRFLLGNYFTMPEVQFSSWYDWRSLAMAPLMLFSQLNFLQWQSWVAILLSFNVGAMIGPSMRDLGNVWPMLIILFFVRSALLTSLAFAALGLILFNILLQSVAILFLAAARRNAPVAIIGAILFIIAAVVGIGQVVILDKAHATFDNYYRFRDCVQLLEKTDTYGTCKTASGATIKIVDIGGKWYLDGDGPGVW